MAEFKVSVVVIDDVYEHPNADRLTIVKIGGYTCIANKHEDGSWRYQKGDAVVYIPENALVPEWLLRKQEMWNEEKGIGYLAGSKGNRVKAIKLRGIYSEGILYPVKKCWFRIGGGIGDGIELEKDAPGRIMEGSEHPFRGQSVVEATTIGTPNEHWYYQYPVCVGEDVGPVLGITKYEPEIPTNMGGEVFYVGESLTDFDLEPWERYPDLISEGELVVFMEKLHGTFTGIKIIPGLDHPDAFMAPWGSRDILVFSKGLGSKGLAFKDVEANANNVYVRGLKSLLGDKFWEWYDGLNLADHDRLVILGETFGKGIQDLHYGLKEASYRVFLIGVEGQRIMEWVGPSATEWHANVMGSQVAPILYHGPFSEEIMIEYRDGKTTVGGDHIREGIVIYPMVPRRHPEFGHVRLKAVSPDYKLRKGDATEYN